jgi:hypothetical protein
VVGCWERVGGVSGGFSFEDRWYGVKFAILKTSAGAAVGFGLADSNGNAGLVNPYTVGNGVVYSGSYTPTLVNGTNITSVTLSKASYMRVGKMVTVYLEVAVDPVATGAYDFGITLPIASNLISTSDLSGTGVRDESTTFSVLQLRADAGNDRAAASGYATTYTGGSTTILNFMYEIK